MTRRIKLTTSTPSPVRLQGHDSFRVQIVASEGEDIPNEIFGHQRTLIDIDTGDTCDEFMFVCSAYDLSIYPANAPDAEQFPQFFRKDTLDILVPGITAADAVIEDVQTQVCKLIEVLDLIDEMAAMEPVWCPSPPDDSSESSE